jgi:hypothetical protein
MDRALPRPLDLPRLTFGLAIAIGLGIGFALYQLKVNGFGMNPVIDGDAYWLAAIRLREGAPLYSPGHGAADPLVFRYGAWFAWLWVPLTYLPHLLVITAWRLGLVACALALIPMLRGSHWATLALWVCVPPLIASGIHGSVQPLVVLLAVSGPIGLGFAAGIKAAPIAFVALYLWRREWRSALLAVAITAVLWATSLTANLSDYPTVRSFWWTDATIALVLLRFLRTPSER